MTSGATGETMLSGCYLFTYEKRTELNSFESKILVLVTGIDSGAARSVVLVGKIPRYSVVRDSETGRVYKSATGERVIDQEQQQILGTVDGKVRRLYMCAAQVRKILTSVYDMCAAGHRVFFDFDSNNNGVRHAENKLPGEKTYFKLRNRVWELLIAVIPKTETDVILTQNAETRCRGVVLFRGAGSLAVRSFESPADPGPNRVDEEQQGRNVI